MNEYSTGSAEEKQALDALYDSLNSFGRVNLPYMAMQSGQTTEQLAHNLRGQIFLEPEQYELYHDPERGWQPRALYLSGSIKHKLDTARRVQRRYPLFQENIRALEQILPPPPDFDGIGLCIGSPWIPENIYADFLRDTFRLRGRPQVEYSAALGQWRVLVSKPMKNALANTHTYGTERISGFKIMEHSLNAQTVKIYDQTIRPELKTGFAMVLNRTETIAAQEKQTALQAAFLRWLHEDTDRMHELTRIYYDTCGGRAAPRFDGSFLTFPGLNKNITLFPHQRNAAARMILCGDVLLNHAVGSGKTFEIIVGLHERRRLGLSRKNLVVVPNNVLDAFADAHQLLYPGDRFRVIYPRDFTPTRRQNALEIIRDCECDAIYMAFSSFERIHMGRQYRLDSMRRELETAQQQYRESGRLWERQALDSLIGRLSEKYFYADLPEDNCLPYEALGIDTLVVDEAHNFKNISLHTRTDGVVGMHAAGSKRCDELMEKVQYTRSHGGSVIFSTGTPLTNSLSDLYTLQRYLQPEALTEQGLDRFDAWISNFAYRQTGFEIDVDSRSFRIMTRFSGFHNLPELTALFGDVCDFYSGADSGMGLPHCEGHIDITVPRSAEQHAYIDSLVERTELIRARLVRRDQDNLLSVTNDGRAAAVDIRLVEPDELPAPHSTKAAICAQHVFEIYQKYPGTAQLIFCDLGTPKAGFNLYDELRDRLRELGISDKEIAYIHNADTESARRRLFEDVNAARVRVLIGSTAKLGLGVNVQERLIALHHVDVPWRPSDMTQREGRILRHGNRCEEVFIYRYITAGTFDAYSWQIIENKQRFIARFMADALTDREARDLEDTVLSYAEIKALAVGDPLLKTRVETANLLERAKISRRQKDAELAGLRRIAAEAAPRLDELTQIIARLRSDIGHFKLGREEIKKTEREAFGTELLDALGANTALQEPRFFDSLHGFAILLPDGMMQDRPYVLVEGISGNRYEVDMRGAKPLGCARRIENMLSRLPERITAAEEQMAEIERRRDQAAADAGEENPFDAEVENLTLQLSRIDAELNARAAEAEE